MPNEPIGYMSHGFRRYGEFPVRLRRREYWEIQCIFSGRARPEPAISDQKSPQSPVLYIFEPMHPHGWTAPSRDVSEILVIHVRGTGLAWSELGFDGATALSLTEIDLLRIKTLFEWMHPHWVEPTDTGNRVLESGGVLLADLVRQKLLVPHRVAVNDARGPGSFLRRVENARRYYREYILSNPKVEEVARAIGVSASQLRRIFAAAGQPPPGIVFRSIQMDYARRLLAAAGRSVSEISEDLGFDSPSAFSRSFKNHFGESPLNFRARGTRRDGNSQ